MSHPTLARGSGTRPQAEVPEIKVFRLDIGQTRWSPSEVRWTEVRAYFPLLRTEAAAGREAITLWPPPGTR